MALGSPIQHTVIMIMLPSFRCNKGRRRRGWRTTILMWMGLLLLLWILLRVGYWRDRHPELPTHDQLAGTLNEVSSSTTTTSSSQATTTKTTSDDHLSETSPDYCQYYDGVLWISQGDRNGAAGTIFFLFLLNQLLYAQKYNLQPWIHLTNVSRHVYDNVVHSSNGADSKKYQFTQLLEYHWEHWEDSKAYKVFHYPGKPILPPPDAPLVPPISIQAMGTGVWNSYFESTVELALHNANYQVDLTKPCSKKPLVHFTSDQALVQGLHLACPYCVRAWKYGGMPPSLQSPTNSYQAWWQPMRERGHDIAKTYYQPNAWLQPFIPKLPPKKCLGLHIRHSDKANKRKKIPLAAFVPYLETFVAMGGTCIYLATDSSHALHKLQEEWPASVVDKLRFQANSVRSSNATAVFDAVLYMEPQAPYSHRDPDKIPGRHHRTNTEVLVDIYALAQCDWLLHGLSAVSEAAIYVSDNLRHQNRAINLEFYQYYQRHPGQKNDPDAPMPLEKFRAMLQQTGLS